MIREFRVHYNNALLFVNNSKYYSLRAKCYNFALIISYRDLNMKSFLFIALLVLCTQHYGLSQIPTNNYQRLDGTLTAIKVLHDNQCAVFGEEGTLILSSDNGITWRSTYLATQETPISITDFPDDSVYIVAFGSYQIMRSTNKGITWKKQSIPFMMYRIWSGQSTLFAINENEKLLYSNDKGITWFENSSLSNHTIRDGFMSPNGTIVLLTTQSTYIKSDDEGKTWSEEYNFPTSTPLPKLTNHYTHTTYSYVLFDTILYETNDWNTFNRFILPTTAKSCVKIDDTLVYLNKDTPTQISGNDSIAIYSLTSKTIEWKKPYFLGMPLLYDVSFNALMPLSDGSLLCVGKSKQIIRIIHGKSSLISYCMQYKTAVNFYDESRGIVGSSRQRFCTTTNGGATWNFYQNKPDDTLLNDIVEFTTQVYAQRDSVFIAFFGANLLPRISRDNGNSFSPKGFMTAMQSNFYTPISLDSFFTTGQFSSKKDTANVYLHTESGKKLTLLKKVYGRSIGIYPRSVKEYFLLIKRNIDDKPGGYMLYTNNGGITYDSTEIPDATSPISIYFYEKSDKFLLNVQNSSQMGCSIYETTDRGKTWLLRDLVETTFITQLWRDQKSNRYFQARSNNEIYYSDDEGTQWKKNIVMPDKTTLFPSADSRALILFDRRKTMQPDNVVSLYRCVPDSLHNTVTNIIEDEKDVRRYSAPVFIYPPLPNPFTSSLRFDIIWLSYSQPHQTSLIVYNQMGEKVADISHLCKNIIDGNKKTTIEWIPDSLVDGLYFLEARVQGYSSVRHIIKYLR